MFSPNGRTRVVTSPSGFPGHRGSAGFTVAVASGRTRWMPAWQPSAARITSALGRWEIASAVPIGMSTYRRRAAELADMPWSLEDVQGLAFSPNGRWMAICGPDGTIRVYRLRG
jgi:WD40 repeat protein